MYTDNGLLLATAEVVPNGGAAPGGIGAASATLNLDLSGTTSNLRSFCDPGAGEELALNIAINTSVTSATFASTLEIQLISLPISLALLTAAATSGKTLTITGVVTDSTADTLTVVGHGLPLGTPIHLTSIVTTTGITTGTYYYVVPTTANAFKLAASLALAIAGTTIDLLTGNGTATVNFTPTVHATTGTQTKDLYFAGTRILIPLIALAGITPRQALPAGQTLTKPLGTSPLAGAVTGATSPAIASNAQQFFGLRYIPSATVTAGAFTVHLVHVPGEGLKHMPSGFTLVG